jgi:hypothetical protein
LFCNEGVVFLQLKFYWYFNLQTGVGILNPGDMNSLHGSGSMDASDQEQGPASQDTLDGLDGKKLFSLSNYLKHFLLISQ